MSLILFSPVQNSPISKPFSIGEQATVSAVGLQGGDYITFERIQYSETNAPRICGCQLIPPSDLTILGTQELLCPDCPPIPTAGEEPVYYPVRVTERNPIIILDFPQNSVLRAVYHGTGLSAGEVLVTLTPSETTELTPAMRGCPPPCCGIDYPEVWNETGEKRCDNASQTVQVLESSNCGNTRWVTDPTQPLNYWAETGVRRCENATQTVQVQEVNPCGELRWVADPTPPTPFWFETGEKRCDDASQTVEVQEQNPCGETRWVPDPTPPAEYWAETGAKRCDNATQTVQVQQTNPCGGLRWVTDPTPPPNYWAFTGVEVCSAAGVLQQQEVNPCGETRWVNTTFACVSRGWNAQATLPLPCDGMAFRPAPYTRDPAATVVLETCEATPVPIGYIYPTPRIGASTPVVDCDCAVIGFAVDGRRGACNDDAVCKCG